ncbi:MAG: DHA2 family efflux MFS transporter permease subunit [Slackia sp.]|nr:DHA2 family efflux MFS transporter permease subunit [Slackia sp.]
MRIEGGKRWVYALFAVVVLGSALGNLSQTGLNAMLVAICDEFGIETAQGQLLTTAYMFVLGAVVPLSAYFMGRFRLKDLSAGSVALFLAGSLVCACAGGFVSLFVGRLMQAASAGMLLPVLQTIAMTRFPDGRKATAMGIAGVAMGFAPNIGPTIGGAMVDASGWRSFFVLLSALSAAVLLFCVICIERHDDASYPAHLDFLSFVLSAVAFGGVLVGCSEASSVPVTHPFVWAPIALGAISLAWFVVRQRRIDDPLIDMGIFSDDTFRFGFAAQCFLCASFMGITLLVPLYVESLRGGTPLQAGMVLLPATIAALIVNPVAGVLTDKIGVRPVALTSGVLLVAGSIAMAFIDESTPLWLVCAMQGVRALGVSGLIGPLSSWSLTRLSGKRIADGSAFSIAVRQTCASVGTALMVFCVEGAALAGAMAFHAAFAVSAVFAVATFVCIAARVR